ncbi:phosphate ABC transporter substrate-binding protein [Gemmatimonadota bacterium]
MKRSVTLLVTLALTVSCGGGSEGGSGSRTLIQNKGSDTLVNVAQAWAEAYGQINANVAVAVSGGGSGTGFSALINGTVDIANASRQIRESEIEAVQSSRAVEPLEFIVGYDALAVYLHQDNPIDAVTISELASVYGEGGPSDRWEDLGVSVPGCSSDEIVRVSRQNNSGTYAYFREAILGEEIEYKLGSRDMHGSKDVVDLVENTPCAIGYSGLAYATDHVKMPCVATEAGSPCIPPTMETAVDRSYPISRPLFMYTAGEPEGAARAYLDWILSDEGQCILVEKGYAPVREDLSCAATVSG